MIEMKTFLKKLFFVIVPYLPEGAFYAIYKEELCEAYLASIRVDERDHFCLTIEARERKAIEFMKSTKSEAIWKGIGIEIIRDFSVGITFAWCFILYSGFTLLSGEQCGINGYFWFVGLPTLFIWLYPSFVISWLLEDWKEVREIHKV